MNDTNLLENQPIAWTPTPDVIERARQTQFMKQVGVSTWDELYAYSIGDVERFTEEVLKFLDIRFDPPCEKLLDTSDGVEFPNWFGTRRSLSESEAIAEPQADKDVRVPNQVGNSTPSDVSSNFSYGGSKRMSRNFKTSSVNLSTSLIEYAYNSSQVETPTCFMNCVSRARSITSGVGVQAMGWSSRRFVSFITSNC